jgi:chemotaxis protein methyltransferase CheR
MTLATRKTAIAAAPSEAVIAEPPREFAFSDGDFRALAQFAYEQAGIALSDSKRNLVYSRLSRRLRALSLNSFRQYRDYLGANPSELESFLNAISTNLTKFFREAHHFEHFRTHVAAPFARGGSAARKLRIWSAGCSTGEEPYTIAVVLKHEIGDTQRHDIRILATDIDTDVLKKGARGLYPSNSLSEVPKSYWEFFESEESNGADRNVVLRDDVRALIAFRRLNLMEAWPFNGPFDAIFCRNVIIYFDKDTQRALFARIAQLQRPGDLLFLGHSESLYRVSDAYTLVGKTIYRRS